MALAIQEKAKQVKQQTLRTATHTTSQDYETQHHNKESRSCLHRPGTQQQTRTDNASKDKQNANYTKTPTCVAFARLSVERDGEQRACEAEHRAMLFGHRL